MVTVGRAALAVAFILAVMFILRPGHSDSARSVVNDPTVWMSSESRGEVVQVNAFTGDVTGRVAAASAGTPLTVAQFGSHAIVLDETLGEARRLDAVRLALDSDPLAADVQAVASNDGVAVVVAREQVIRLRQDPTALPTVIETAIDAEAAAIATSEQAWILGADGELATLAVAGEVTVAESDVDALVTAGPDVFGVEGTRIVNLATGRDQECEGLVEAGNLGGGVRVAGSPVVAGASTDGAVLWWLDVDRGDCRRVRLSETPAEMGRPVIGDDAIFIPNLSAGSVIVVDLDSGRILRRFIVSAPNTDVELIGRDGIVWMNQPRGDTAAIIDRDSVILVDKRSGAASTPVSGAAGGDGLGVGAVFRNSDEGAPGALAGAAAESTDQ